MADNEAGGKPLPDVVEWADATRLLCQGPQVGQPMKMSETPYLEEVLRFCVDPWAPEGTVLKAARIGYTEGIIGTMIVWTVSVDPCTMAVLQPTDLEAKSYSRDNITKMIEVTPALREQWGHDDRKGSGRRRRDTTMAFKGFEGGHLEIFGSVSPVNLRRRSVKRAFADEVDGMEINVKEGDPLELYATRGQEYADFGGFMLCGSTPTLRGDSLIAHRYAESDKRVWECPCPHCGHWQVVEWRRIRWDKISVCGTCDAELYDHDDPRCPGCQSLERKTRHLTDTAYLQCENEDCKVGQVREGPEKRAMIQAGRWKVRNPHAKLPGWHIPQLISLLPGASWPRQIDKFLAAKGDPAKHKVWTNTILGEVWEDLSERPSVSALEARAEQYVTPQGEIVMVPEGVGVLTAGVDVQDRRLELLVRGWGIDDESWDILHQRIQGDTDDPATWAILDSFLARPYQHASGAALRIVSTFVDSGHRTRAVYRFCGPRERRRVWACKGDAGHQGYPSLVDPGVTTRKANKYKNIPKIRLWHVGTFAQKESLFARLLVPEPGPRYIHLRAPDPDICNGFDAAYFKQFESEAKVLDREDRGRKIWRWKQLQDRNEAIDLHVYATAAYDALGIRETIGEFVALASSGAQPPAPRRRVRSKGAI